MIVIPKKKNLTDMTTTGALMCPECKSPIFPSGGCFFCVNCGWSSCNG